MFEEEEDAMRGKKKNPNPPGVFTGGRNSEYSKNLDTLKALREAFALLQKVIPNLGVAAAGSTRRSANRRLMEDAKGPQARCPT